MLTDTTGAVEIDVPRDRSATFEPQIVKKRQRRLSGVDEVVLSLYAKGLTTGEISAHFAEIYGASVSKETISRITDKVIEEMNDWAVRPLDETYAAIFIDAIVVKVRDGQVANRPFYAAIGVTLAGERDILGLWAGTGGEGAKFWMSVADRSAQPRRQGRVLRDLRRVEGTARGGRQRVAASDRADVIYQQWVGRDGLGVHLHHHGQDLCKRVTFEVHMQTRPPVVAAGLGPASESSTTGISGECRDEVPGGPRNCSVSLQVEGI